MAHEGGFWALSLAKKNWSGFTGSTWFQKWARPGQQPASLWAKPACLDWGGDESEASRADLSTFGNRNSCSCWKLLNAFPCFFICRILSSDHRSDCFLFLTFGMSCFVGRKEEIWQRKWKVLFHAREALKFISKEERVTPARCKLFFFNWSFYIFKCSYFKKRNIFVAKYILISLDYTCNLLVWYLKYRNTQVLF